MDTTKIAPYVMLAAGVCVTGHAIINEQYCIDRPMAHSCHNPIAPGPDLPHELMTSTWSVSTGMPAVIVGRYF